jgi:hypothetical protein
MKSFLLWSSLLFRIHSDHNQSIDLNTIFLSNDQGLDEHHNQYQSIDLNTSFLTRDRDLHENASALASRSIPVDIMALHE